MSKITAHDIEDFKSCSRKIWLKRFQPEDCEADETSGFMRYLAEQGTHFENQCLKTINEYHEPSDYDETVELMKEGFEWIYQAVLEDDFRIGKPDLLRKNSNKSSKFGDYSYDVIDVKSAKLYKDLEQEDYAKFEDKKKKHQKSYGLQLWHYKELLQEIQQTPPEMFLWVRDREQYTEIEFEYQVQQKFKGKEPINNIYENIIDEIQDMKKENELEVFKCGDCNKCVWKSYCYSKMEEKNHCSLIYGMDRRARDDLKSNGIQTIEDFYKKVDFGTKLKYVLTGQDAIKTKRIKTQAQSLLENKDFYLGDKLKGFDVDYLLFYDIEGEMGHEFEYLHGIWEVNKKTGEKRYISFITSDFEKEGVIWKEFLEYIKDISKKGSFQIIYFADYERVAWLNLTDFYQTSREDLKLLMDNSIDILKEWITNKLILPKYNYSIKTVAPYFGFEWECKNNTYKDEEGNDFQLDEANGGESIAWLDYWLSGKEHFKQIIIDYNKDDCIGTEFVYEEMLKKYK